MEFIKVDETRTEEIKENFYTVDIHGTDVKVRKFLNAEQYGTLVYKTANDLFDEDEGHDSYTPLFKSFFLKLNFLEAATDLYLGEDLNEAFVIVSSVNFDRDTGIFFGEDGELINNQFLDSIQATEEIIGHRLQISYNGLEVKAKTLITQVENLFELIKELFGGIDNEDIKRLTEAMSNGKIDEEKMMKTYLNETRNLDVDAPKGDRVIKLSVDGGDEDVE